MKKVLSVVLAVMMLFSVMAVNTSAVNNEMSSLKGEGDFLVILELGECKLNIAKLKGSCVVYTEDGIKVNAPATVTGTVLVASSQFTYGAPWDLPVVTAPSEQYFQHWYASHNYSIYAGGQNGTFTFPEDGDFANDMLCFTAVYDNIPEEGDTMATVINVLVKVFGAILGILLYAGDTEAGVAMMNKILGGLEL